MTDPPAIERFTALYDEHHRSVYAYAVSKAGRQLADEVTGEVFLVAWRRLAGVQPDSAGGVRREGRQDRRRLRHPKAALGAGLTLAAAAACVALLLATDGLAPATKPPAGHPTAGRPSPGPTGVASLTAQQILLTAAVSAAKQPSQGRYWRVEDVNGSVEAAGPNAHPYAVEQIYAPETSWDARSPKQRSWEYPSTGYTTRPATKGAAAAWQAVLVGTGPVAEQAPGQVQSFDAIVSAGWTNASPALPPASQQFSVAKDSKG